MDAGKCYQAAYTACELLSRQDIHLQIVHGNPRHGGLARARRIGHAWNELINESYAVPHAIVFDFSQPSLVILPRDLFCAAGRITVTRTYSRQKAELLFEEHVRRPSYSSKRRKATGPGVMRWKRYSAGNFLGAAVNHGGHSTFMWCVQ